MLYRILNVRQDKEKDFKIWYTDDYWDLYIWVDGNKRISAFHLSYGKPENEHIIMWGREGNSFRVARVESGEDDPSQNRSPMLVEAGKMDIKKVITRFSKDSKNIDPAIGKFIITKLKKA